MRNFIDSIDFYGPEGIMKQLTRALAERTMEVELTEHPGYEKCDLHILLELLTKSKIKKIIAKREKPMMGRKSKQLCMVMIEMQDLSPQGHLVRKISEHIDFNFIYEATVHYYSAYGRPLIDPVCLMKMLLIGYIYGIKTERRLEEEVTLNIVCRWF